MLGSNNLRLVLGFMLVLSYRAALVQGVENKMAVTSKAAYTVSIQDKKRQHLCSGAIIDSEWIVTTAQCLRGRKLHMTKDIIVVTGAQHLRQSSKVSIYKLDYLLFHPIYDRPLKGNDIVLGHTKVPIKFNANVRSIEIDAEPQTMAMASRAMIVTWSGIKTSNRPLKTLPLNILPYQNCREAYDNSLTQNPIDVSHFCLKVPKNSSFCNLGIGDPVVANNKLVGLLSFGPKCANGNPYVVSRISFFYDFIRTKTMGCSKCKKIDGYVGVFFAM